MSSGAVELGCTDTVGEVECVRPIEAILDLELRSVLYGSACLEASLVALDHCSSYEVSEDAAVCTCCCGHDASRVDVICCDTGTLAAWIRVLGSCYPRNCHGFG